MLASVIISHNSNIHCTRIHEICLLNVQPCSYVPIKNFHARIFHSMSPGFFCFFLPSAHNSSGNLAGEHDLYANKHT